MAALELHDTEGPMLKENIRKAIEGLEQPLQKVLFKQSMVSCSRDKITVEKFSVYSMVPSF